MAVAGWGYWFGIVGLILTIAGFAITFIQVRKAKSASEAVSAEVERIRLSLARYDAAQEIAKANYALGSARRHLRNDAWIDLADSYEDVRRVLIQFKESSLVDDNEIVIKIDEASNYIEKLCTRIESGIIKPPVSINVHKTHSMMRKHGELIAKISTKVEKDIV